MDDLLATTPVEETPTEVATPEVATDAPDDSNLEVQDDAEADGAEEELSELDYGGFKVKAPKGFAELIAPILEKADNLEAGYTKKYQEAAELRKTFEGRLQEVSQQEQISAEIGNDLAQLRAVDGRLAQLQEVNWPEWRRADPQAAQDAQDEMLMLQNAQQNLRGHVEGRKAEIAARQEHMRATLISEAVEALSKPDPTYAWDGKFDADKKAKLTGFGKEMGFTDEELAGTTHPLMIKVLNLAYLKSVDLKKLKTAIKAPSQPVANPVPIVTSAKTKSTVNPDKLNPDQWMKWRNDQAKKNGYR